MTIIFTAALSKHVVCSNRLLYLILHTKLLESLSSGDLCIVYMMTLYNLDVINYILHVVLVAGEHPARDAGDSQHHNAAPEGQVKCQVSAYRAATVALRDNCTAGTIQAS